jgi:hypothetical protein
LKVYKNNATIIITSIKADFSIHLLLYFFSTLLYSKYMKDVKNVVSGASLLGFKPHFYHSFAV